MKKEKYQSVTRRCIVFLSNSQQPVNSNQQTDVLGWQAYSSQDQEHSHQAGTGNTGCSDTGQGGRQTGWGKKVALSHILQATPNHILRNRPYTVLQPPQTPMKVK